MELTALNQPENPVLIRPQLPTVPLLLLRHKVWSDDNGDGGLVAGLQHMAQKGAELIHLRSSHPPTLHEIDPNNARHVRKALKKLKGSMDSKPSPTRMGKRGLYLNGGLNTKRSNNKYLVNSRPWSGHSFDP